MIQISSYITYFTYIKLEEILQQKKNYYMTFFGLQVFVCEILNVERRGPFSAMYSVMHSIGFASQVYNDIYHCINLSIYLFIYLINNFSFDNDNNQ